jgi:hypothetical protein
MPAPEYHVQPIPRSLMAAFVAAHHYAVRVPPSQGFHRQEGRAARRRSERRSCSLALFALCQAAHRLVKNSYLAAIASQELFTSRGPARLKEAA